MVRSIQGMSMLLAVMCAGCFRSATEPLEPTAAPLGDSAVLNLAATPGAFPTDGLVVAPPTDGAAPGLPPITVIAPATEAPTSPDLAAPALTMVLLEPATSTPQPTPENTVVALPTLTLQIITPGVSLGLLTPDATALPTRTPAPTLAPGETASEDGAPAEADDEASVDSLEPVSADGCIYTVASGDTLYGIAVSQDTTIRALLAANPDLPGDTAILQIDQELNLPACIPGLEAEATDEAVDAEATDEVPPGGQIYIVQSGDVLGSIASRFGVTVRAIVQANNLPSADVLSVGQRLIIPPRAE